MHQLKCLTPTTNGEALDQYFTKPEIVQRCLDELDDLSDYDLVIEPSAGSGAFLSAVKHENKIGLDIDPQHKAVVLVDWLEYDVPNKYDSVLVVGNPPYGWYHKVVICFYSASNII